MNFGKHSNLVEKHLLFTVQIGKCPNWHREKYAEACRQVAGHRPRDKKIYKNRYWVTTS
jgi:hypothetical protein